MKHSITRINMDRLSVVMVLEFYFWKCSIGVGSLGRSKPSRVEIGITNTYNTEALKVMSVPLR